MGILRYSAFLFLLLMLSASLAFGGGFTFDGIGVKARGMGGAFRAVADDWSAAYYNPAGYARIQDNYIAANLAAMHNRYWTKPNIYWGDQYESGFFNGQDIANHHEILNVPQGGILARLPVWGETVFGFSIIQSFDQNLNWELYQNLPGYNPQDYPDRQFHNNLDAVEFQVTAARNFLDDKLSLGVGLAVVRGDLYFTDVVLHRNPMPSPISDRPYDKIPQWYRADGNGWGFGLRAGLLYDLTEKLSGAFVVSGPTSMNITGETESRFYMPLNPSAIQNYGYRPGDEEYLFSAGEIVMIKSDFETDIDLPASIAGAISYQVNDKLTIAVDAEMTFWSSFKGYDFSFTKFEGLKDPSFVNANDSLFIRQHALPVVWDDAFRVMAGANYRALRFLELRAGFGFDQSPVTGETFTPYFFDLGDKLSVNFGFGFEVNQWNLDFATGYTKQDDLTVSEMTFNDDGTLKNMTGDYRGTNYQTVLGISYRF